MNVWLRFLSGGLAGQTLQLTVPEGGALSIGRADDNNVVLPADIDVAASSHHAQLVAQGGALHLYDQGSTNGTWINGQRVQHAPISNGTRVTFGRGGPEAEIYWQADQPAPPPPAPAPEPAPAPLARPAPEPPGGAKTAPQAFQAFAAMPSPEHMPQAYQQPPQPVQASDTCGMCGTLLFFICYQCRRTLCGSHYDPATGVCVECAGVQPAAAPPPFGAPPAYEAPTAYAAPPAFAGPSPSEVDDMPLPPRRRKPGAGGPPPDDELPPRRRRPQ